MNYNNIIILLDDFLFWKSSKKEIKVEFNKSTFYNGIILNDDEFIKKFLRSLRQNKISTFFFNKSLQVIYDSEISKNDLEVIKNVFNNLNYRNISYYSDISLIRKNKRDTYLLVGSKYKLVYIDSFNNKKTIVLDPEISNKELNIIISNRSYKKNLFIIGTVNDKVISNNMRYYIYESKLLFFLQKIELSK